jgi:hypothetical protein
MQKIAPAFVAAKRAFGPALKDRNNPHFKSKYADLGACIDAVEDALLANGIAFYQETFEDGHGVTVETVLLHESGESLRCGKLHVPAAKHDPQGYGSALTYARRYSLMAACGIAPEDDDGNSASKAVSEASKAPQSFRSSATMGVYETLPPARQKVVDAVVREVIDLHAANDMAGAFGSYDAMEDDERVAVRGKLPSNIKTALAKYAESIKEHA